MRRKVMNRRELTEGQKSELLLGFCFPGDKGYEKEEDMKKSYFQHRTYILSLIGGESFEGYPYGKRPYSWWQFEELPEKRRIVSYFTRDNSSNSEPMPIRESQFEYLKRNNLLFDNEEAEYMKRKQAERVTV